MRFYGLIHQIQCNFYFVFRLLIKNYKKENNMNGNQIFEIF